MESNRSNKCASGNSSVIERPLFSRQSYAMSKGEYPLSFLNESGNNENARNMTIDEGNYSGRPSNVYLPKIPSFLKGSTQRKKSNKGSILNNKRPSTMLRKNPNMFGITTKLIKQSLNRTVRSQESVEDHEPQTFEIHSNVKPVFRGVSNISSP